MSLRTLSLAESAGPLGLDPIKRLDPVIFRGPVAPGIFGGYRAQFWRRPTDAATGGAPLATAEGTISGAEASIAFTGAQMDLPLRADRGYYDHFWLVISGTQQADLAGAVLRRGWIEMRAAAFGGAL